MKNFYLFLFLFLPLKSLFAQISWYYNGTGPLNSTSSWGTNANGTGGTLVDFTSGGRYFIIQNTTAVSLSGSWTIGNTNFANAGGDSLIIGNPTTPSAPITLTLLSGSSLTVNKSKTISVSQPSTGNHLIIYQNTTPLSLGTINDPSLAITFDGATITSSSSSSFGTVSLKNNANVDMGGASLVCKNLSIEAGSILSGPIGSSSQYIAIKAGGIVTINGTFKAGRTGTAATNSLYTTGVAIPVITSTSYATLLFNDATVTQGTNLILGSNSTIEYYRGNSSGQAGAQTIAALNYGNLSLSNLSYASNKQFATSGTVSVSGTMTANLLTGATIIAPTIPINLLPGAKLVMSSATAFPTGGNLILQSSSAGSASISALATGASITGNVTVQRYVGTSQQWRMVGFPFQSSTSILASALATLYGSGYNAYTYNESKDDGTNYNGANGGAVNAGWETFTGSATTTADKGILLIGGTPGTIVSATGALNTSPTTVTLSSTTGKGWNLVSNPFASNITWSTVQAASTNVDATVYRYNPATTSYSSYNATTSTSSDGNQTNVIENGAGFFVHVTAPGTAASLSVAEAAKTALAPGASLFGMSPLQNGNITSVDGTNNAVNGSTTDQSIIRLTLLKEGETNGGDAVVLRWGGGYAATDNFDPQFDAYDLGRSAGPDLSVIGDDKTAYSIFHGAELKSSTEESRTVQLGIKNIAEGNYQIGIHLLSAIAGDNKAYLFDSYTNQYTLIDGTADNYNFLVTSDAGSQSSARFSVVMNHKEIINTIHTDLPVMLLNNPSNGNMFTLYSKNNYAQLQWQIMDGAGRLLLTGSFSNVLKGNTFQINAGNTTPGSYYIKLNGDGNALPVLKALKN